MGQATVQKCGSFTGETILGEFILFCAEFHPVKLCRVAGAMFHFPKYCSGQFEAESN